MWIMLEHHDLGHSFDVCEFDRNQKLYENFTGHSALKRPYHGHFVASNIPLAVGEALVLKQPEIHRTDKEKVRKDQKRLAIGFKVMRKGQVNHTIPDRSPFGRIVIRDSKNWKSGYLRRHVFDRANFAQGYWR